MSALLCAVIRRRARQ